MNKSFQKGFTLVEVLVTIVIFSFVLIIVSSIFVYSLNLQRRALNLQQAEENAAYVIEFLTKEIRVATITLPAADSNCPSIPSSSLTIDHPDTGIIKYYLSGSDLIREVNGVPGVVNSNTVRFVKFDFCVRGVPAGDMIQPRVTLSAAISSTKTNQQATIDIQTTISSRVLSN